MLMRLFLQVEEGSSEIASMHREIEALKSSPSGVHGDYHVSHGAIGGSSNAVVNINFPGSGGSPFGYKPSQYPEHTTLNDTSADIDPTDS